MKSTNVIAVIIMALFIGSACDTVLGPPGSELPLPPPRGFSPYDMLVEGEPNTRAFALKGGFFIWKTGDLWHIRAATAEVLSPFQRRYGMRDVFTGRLYVEGGIITNIDLNNAAPIDVVRSGPDGITFGLEVERDFARGFDFRVRPTTGSRYCVNFDVQFNGIVDPQFIRLGKSMSTPNTLPLNICVLR